MNNDLTGKTAVVTGSSAGIGWGCARGLADAGDGGIVESIVWCPIRSTRPGVYAVPVRMPRPRRANRTRDRRVRVRSDLMRLLAVAVGGLAVGVVTSWMQGVLPPSADFLANSGAVWLVVAFLLASWPARRVPIAVAAGLVSLAGEVVGYYAIASPVRHIATSSSERLLWGAAALLIGPLVGLAAFRARNGLPGQRVAAAAALCGVVAGEGWYALGRLSYHAQGGIEIAVGVAALLLVTYRFGNSWGSRAIGLPIAVVSAVVVYVAYVLA